MARHKVSEEDSKNTRFKSGSEAARRAGRKGGIRSGEVRNLKSLLLKALNDGGYDKMVDVALREMENGNPKFWELIRDTIGEKPKDEIKAEIESEITINIDLVDE